MSGFRDRYEGFWDKGLGVQGLPYFSFLGSPITPTILLAHASPEFRIA